MTYEDVVKKVRARTINWSKTFLGWGLDAVMFNLVQDAAREIANQTKDKETTSNLSVVAGTKDYTISSALGTDVDQITFIQTDTGEIKIVTVPDFQTQVHLSVTDEDDAEDGTPEFARIHGGILRLFPTPATTFTATVYHTINIPVLSYSTGNMAATVELNDYILNALINECIALVCEGAGDERRAVYYHAECERKLEKAMVNRARYQSTQIVYSDLE